MKTIRTMICCALCACWLAAFAAPLKTERFLLYKVERITPAEAPAIDGKLDEAIWKDRPVLSSLRNFLGSNVGDIPTQRSEFVVLTDGVKLYIAATLYEEKMDKLLYSPANLPWSNDSVELYFDPLHNGRRNIQLTLDCGGQKFWHKMFDDGYGWWNDDAWQATARWDSAAGKKADAWTLEIALDCASFGFDAKPGNVVGFNPCRFRLGSQPQEWGAWAYGPNNRQKDMAVWGHLLFMNAGEHVKGQGVTRADVNTVYPDLTDRVIEVPVDGGFMKFTTAGEKRETFKELLQPASSELQKRCTQTQAIIDKLAPDNAELAGFKSKLAEVVTSLTREQAIINAPTLTLGGYEAINDRLIKLQVNADKVYWRARLIMLITTGDDGSEE